MCPRHQAPELEHVGLVAFELTGDAPVINDRDPVTQRHQLVEIFGDQEHGATARAYSQQLLVHRPRRSGVEAACRVVGQQVARVVR